jgi:hypothetical protein
MRWLFAHGWLVLLLCSFGLVVETGTVLAVSKIQDEPEIYLRRFPDTLDYEDLAATELSDPAGLRHARTWGFPLLLKLVRNVFPNYFWLPWIHLGMHVAAVLVLYGGLRQVGFPPVAAVLACLPVLFSDLITRQLAMRHILTDASGQAWMILSFGAFFLVLARPSRPLRWLLLALGIFAAYQTRPAYQSLIVVMPLCGLLLYSFVPQGQSRWFFLATLALVSFGPWLGYCAYRKHMVGDFGLVSFSGTNLVGITSVILTDDMVPNIRPEYQPMARHILAKRGTVLGFRRYGETFYPPMPPGGTFWDLDLERCYWQYDEIQWQCAWHYAYYTECFEDQVSTDRTLTEFSIDVIKAAPGVYFAVVAHSFCRAVLHIVNRDATLVPLLGFCLLLMVAGVVRLRSGPPPPDSARAQQDAGLLTLISVPAILLFLGQTAVTVLVAMPDPRYLDPAACLVPSIIMVAIYEVGRRLGSRHASAAVVPRQYHFRAHISAPLSAENRT